MPGGTLSISDGARLRADGVPITLVDGSTVVLRFDFDALCELETTFGSIADFVAQLAAKNPLSGRHFQMIAGGVAAGVRHLGAQADGITAGLDPKRVNEYQRALDEAFAESMPEPEKGKAQAPASASPGTSTTGPAPSDSAEATVPSGV